MDTNTETSKKGRPAKRIRIGSRYVDLANRRLGHYPEIRMCGRWLQENGFCTGQYVRVIIEDDRLVLIREPEIKEPAAGRSRRPEKPASVPTGPMEPGWDWRACPAFRDKAFFVPYARGRAKGPDMRVLIKED